MVMVCYNVYCKLITVKWKRFTEANKGGTMLFGHQDDNTTMPSSTVTEPNTPQDTSSLAGTVLSDTAQEPETSSQTASTQPRSAPAFDNPLADETSSTPPPVQPQDTPTTNPTADDSTPSAPVASGDLLDLKQQALGQLAPLVDHLDQTPEEKFRTTMMMIQSTDNEALLKDALEAAKSITDDKARAQALLDVINEINYFTQQKKSA